MSSKQKFQIEFPLKVSTEMLFQYISNPSELSEWFATKVQANVDKYMFSWDGHSEEAKIEEAKELWTTQINDF